MSESPARKVADGRYVIDQKRVEDPGVAPPQVVWLDHGVAGDGRRVPVLVGDRAPAGWIRAEIGDPIDGLVWLDRWTPIILWPEPGDRVRSVDVADRGWGWIVPPDDFQLPVDTQAPEDEFEAQQWVDNYDLAEPPPYYCRGGVEAHDVIESWGLDFRLGNAIKYIARAGYKTPDPVEDLKKAITYLERAIEVASR